MTKQWWVYCDGKLVGAFDSKRDADDFAEEYEEQTGHSTTVEMVKVNE